MNKNFQNAPLFFLVCIFVFTVGCGGKMAQLDSKLRKTIEEGDRGRLKSKIQMRAGFPVDIEKIDIKPTYKELYTYTGVVTFKRKDAVEEKKKSTMPQLGNLPGANARAGRILARFKYLEEEDHWYFDQFI